MKKKRPHRREDLTHEIVRKAYQEEGSYLKVAMKLHCSINLVESRIKDCQDKVNLKKELGKRNIPLCSCCKRRKVWVKNGNRKLC